MSAAGKDGGFTLIEMLVTLAVLGLVSGIAYPALDRALRRQHFLEACARVEAGLRGARADAVGGGRAVRLRGDPDGHGFTAADEEARIDADLRLSLPPEGIAFYPDGSATGGELALDGTGLARRWRVAGGTGAIERLP